MKEVFYITRFYDNGPIVIGEDFDSYGEAIKSIDDLPDDTYQIQKVFIKKS